MTRAITSSELPGEAGTTSRTVWLGQGSARAACGERQEKERKEAEHDHPFRRMG